MVYRFARNYCNITTIIYMCDLINVTVDALFFFFLNQLVRRCLIFDKNFTQAKFMLQVFSAILFSHEIRCAKKKKTK